MSAKGVCLCGHVRHMGPKQDGLCLARGCFCLIHRERGFTDDERASMARYAETVPTMEWESA